MNLFMGAIVILEKDKWVMNFPKHSERRLQTLPENSSSRFFLAIHNCGTFLEQNFLIFNSLCTIHFFWDADSRIYFITPEMSSSRVVLFSFSILSLVAVFGSASHGSSSRNPRPLVNFLIDENDGTDSW